MHSLIPQLAMAGPGGPPATPALLHEVHWGFQCKQLVVACTFLPCDGVFEWKELVWQNWLICSRAERGMSWRLCRAGKAGYRAQAHSLVSYYLAMQSCQGWQSYLLGFKWVQKAITFTEAIPPRATECWATMPGWRNLCWKIVVFPMPVPLTQPAPALAAAQNQKDGLGHNGLVSWPGSAVISFIRPLESKFWPKNGRIFRTIIFFTYPQCSGTG